jgi:hypothetical protein
VLPLAIVKLENTRMSTAGPPVAVCATLEWIVGAVPVHDPVVNVCVLELYVAAQLVVAPAGGV